MQDFVSNGTGNSRYLKSALPEGTSWADALALLTAGTFPIDFNGMNAAGYSQLGTALNKANLLDDTTASALDLSSDDPTVNDALYQISTYFARRQFAHYTGTGSNGVGNECTLTFDFAPRVVFFLDGFDIANNRLAGEDQANTCAIMDIVPTNVGTYGVSAFGSPMFIIKSADGKTVTWWNTSSAIVQLNRSNYEYYFWALA